VSTGPSHTTVFNLQPLQLKRYHRHHHLAWWLHLVASIQTCQSRNWARWPRCGYPMQRPPTVCSVRRGLPSHVGGTTVGVAARSVTWSLSFVFHLLTQDWRLTCCVINEQAESDYNGICWTFVQVCVQGAAPSTGTSSGHGFIYYHLNDCAAIEITFTCPPDMQFSNLPANIFTCLNGCQGRWKLWIGS